LVSVPLSWPTRSLISTMRRALATGTTTEGAERFVAGFAAGRQQQATQLQAVRT